MASLVRISSATGAGFDPSLLTDGLQVEREQGITIDVAYRYFSTPRRQFIIADTPGHEQYTRNMVTGASTADVAVLLIDARKGILSQTCRHAYVAWLLGIRTIIIAINKMDLVGFDRELFERVKEDFINFAAPLCLEQLHFVPLSALKGDNVTFRSDRTPWYKSLPLLELLESVQVHDKRSSQPFRFPVQAVIRADHDFRGYAGQIASGELSVGDRILALPSRREATLVQVVNHARRFTEVSAPMSLVMLLKEHIDLGRGDMLVDPDNPPAETRCFRAQLIWMAASAMRINEPYLVKHTTQMVCMTVLRLDHKINVRTLEKISADTLQLNEIGEVTIETHKPIFCDSYADNRITGSFIVIHPIYNTTLAAGIITQPIAWGESKILSSSFAAIPGESRGLTVWFTGLSGAGKTTLCEAIHVELLGRGIRAEILDGDVVRKHLSRELGFSKSERDENVRRIGFVAQLLSRNGVVALVSAISPYRAVREEVRAGIGNFLEVFVNAPLDICEQRDPKGLYKKVRRGEIPSFTGIDDPYEPPLAPEVECRTDVESIKESVDKVVDAILKKISFNSNWVPANNVNRPDVTQGRS